MPTKPNAAASQRRRFIGVARTVTRGIHGGGGSCGPMLADAFDESASAGNARRTVATAAHDTDAERHVRDEVVALDRGELVVAAVRTARRGEVLLGALPREREERERPEGGDRDAADDIRDDGNPLRLVRGEPARRPRRRRLRDERRELRHHLSVLVALDDSTRCSMAVPPSRSNRNSALRARRRRPRPSGAARTDSRPSRP